MSTYQVLQLLLGFGGFILGLFTLIVTLLVAFSQKK